MPDAEGLSHGKRTAVNSNSMDYQLEKNLKVLDSPVIRLYNVLYKRIVKEEHPNGKGNEKFR